MLRIAQTVAFVEGRKPEQYGDAAAREINLTIGSKAYAFNGLDYVNHVVVPNFYFHVTTAYNILRHNGVELGKADFVGPI